MKELNLDKKTANSFSKCANPSLLPRRSTESSRNATSDPVTQRSATSDPVTQRNATSDPVTQLNTIQFLSEEYTDFLCRCIIRARSIQRTPTPTTSLPDLPSDSLRDIVEEYVRVLCDGKDVLPPSLPHAQLNGYELDSASGLPLWMLLFYLLRCGCAVEDIEFFKADILRHGGSVGNDVYKLLSIFVKCVPQRPLTSRTLHRGTAESVPDLAAVTSRVRGVCHRLTGAGCSDMHKSGNRHVISRRLFLLSLLSNETPYAVNSVIDQNTGDICIPQQEVLTTLQDWLWHKLLVVYGIPEIGA